MRKVIIFISVFLLAVLSASSLISADIEGFVDIKGHWAEDTINSLASKSIISGEYMELKDGSVVPVFYPDREITRAEYTKLIVCTLKDKFDNYQNIYTDVTDDWYIDYIQTAYNLGLINEAFILDNNFKPDEPITREIMAYMTSRAFKERTGGEIQPDNDEYFADYEKVGEWAKTDVQRIKQLNIMHGYNNEFQPEANATRGEAVAVLDRYMNIIDLLTLAGEIQ